MFKQRLHNMSPSLIGTVMGLWLLAASPAAALEDTAQVFMGGQSTAGGNTRFLSPGTPFNQSADFPGTGLGEQSVQLILGKGQLRKLRVNLTTETVPSAGSFALMVRINGADTTLTCSLAATGTCASNATVNIGSGGARMAIRTVNSLVDAGNSIFTYTLIYD